MRFIHGLLSMLLAAWLAATLAFFALRILPGDAITDQLTQNGVSETIIRERRSQQGLDRPIVDQYIRFIIGILQGNLGYSLLNGQPVTALIGERIIPTIILASGASIVGTGLGIILGVAGGIDLRWGLSASARIVVYLILSTPIYWTGTLAILILVGIMPNMLLSASQFVLPVGILGFHTAGAIARTLQTNIREYVVADFVRTARAKGLPERMIIRRHILRAALPSVITVITLQSGFLLGGAVITESLFTRPGIGRLLLDSTLQQDYPVVQGIVILAAFVYMALHFIADIAHTALDPRLS
jgi:ABC-type dipeptide/oligopeptide/nickel transport system permease component